MNDEITKAKRQFNILTLLPESQKSQWKPAEKYWDKYLNYNQIIDTPQNITKYIGKAIDILYLWKGDISMFQFHFYKLFKNNCSSFKYIVISDVPDESDSDMFKALADDIVYTNNLKFLQWKTFAHARRHWDQHSKLTTIIYHDIIADFLDSTVIVNNKKMELTKIETKLLRYLMVRKKTFVSKKQIFNDVWGYEEDNSRNLDQVIFKLKKKIGAKYFHLSRKEGYKFE